MLGRTSLRDQTRNNSRIRRRWRRTGSGSSAKSIKAKMESHGISSLAFESLLAYQRMSSSPARSPALSHCSTGSERKLPSWCVAPAHGAQIAISPGKPDSQPVNIDEHRAYSIGSGSQCDISLPHLLNQISDEHVLLMHSRSGTIFVQDLCSSTGTLLDNVRIPADQPTKFLPESVLTLGENACTIKLLHANPSPKELLACSGDEDEVTRSNTELNRHVRIDKDISKPPLSKRSSSEHVKFVA